VLGEESIAFAKMPIEIVLPELLPQTRGLLMGQRRLTGCAMCETGAGVRTRIATMG
jgi:hypothetical protein